MEFASASCSRTTIVPGMAPLPAALFVFLFSFQAMPGRTHSKLQHFQWSSDKHTLTKSIYQHRGFVMNNSGTWNRTAAAYSIANFRGIVEVLID